MNVQQLSFLFCLDSVEVRRAVVATYSTWGSEVAVHSHAVNPCPLCFADGPSHTAALIIT